MLIADIKEMLGNAGFTTNEFTFRLEPNHVVAVHTGKLCLSLETLKLLINQPMHFSIEASNTGQFEFWF